MITYDNNVGSSLAHLRSVLADGLQFQHSTKHTSKNIDIGEIVDIIVHDITRFTIELDNDIIDQILGRIETKLAARNLTDAYFSSSSINALHDKLTTLDSLKDIFLTNTSVTAFIQLLSSINIDARTKDLKELLGKNNSDEVTQSDTDDAENKDSTLSKQRLLSGLKGLSENDLNDIITNMTFFDKMVMSIGKELTKQLKPLTKLHLGLVASIVALNVAQLDLLRSVITLRASNFGLALSNIKLSIANFMLSLSKIALITSKLALILSNAVVFASKLALTASNLVLALARVTLLISIVSGMLTLMATIILSALSITLSALLTLTGIFITTMAFSAIAIIGIAVFATSIIGLIAITALAAIIGIATIGIVATLALGILLLATIAFGGAVAIAIGTLMLAGTIITAAFLLAAILFGAGLILAMTLVQSAIFITTGIMFSAVLATISALNILAILTITVMFLAGIAAVTAAAALIELALIGGLLILLLGLYFLYASAWDVLRNWWNTSPIKTFFDNLINWWETSTIKAWITKFFEELRAAGGFKEYVTALINEFLQSDPLGQEINSIFGDFSNIHSISDVVQRLDEKYNIMNTIRSTLNKLVDTIPEKIMDALKGYYQNYKSRKANEIKTENPNSTIVQGQQPTSSDQQMPSATGDTVAMANNDMTNLAEIEKSKQDTIDKSNETINTEIDAAMAQEDAEHNAKIEKSDTDVTNMENMSQQLDQMQEQNESAAATGAIAGSYVGGELGSTGNDSSNATQMEK